MLEALKTRARELQSQIHAIYLAARDPRTPWTARGLIILVVAYALSPIDLIPDFVPVLGYLDDLIIVPAGIALALKLVPAEVYADAQRQARLAPPGRLGVLGAAIIVLIWILAIIILLAILRPLLKLKF